MPKILIKNGEKKGQVFRFEKGELTIGREEGMTISVSDKRVSHRHAVIVVKDGKYIIRDNKSTNGTFVNGIMVTEKILKFGDEIKAGDTLLSFLEMSAPETLSEEIPEVKFISEEKGPGGVTVEMAISPEETKKTELANLDKAYQRLDTLYRITQDINSFLELSKLLNRIIELTLQTIKAERGMVMLIDKESGELVPRALSQADAGKFLVSKTIVRELLRSGESILISDTMKDERLKDAESITIQKVRSAMCVPIRTKDSIIGIMYVDTRITVGEFSRRDLEMLTAICNQIGVSIENARLFEDLEKANRELKEKQTELIESEKMAALGHLAGGIVHEVKNPLTGIVGYSQMLLRNLKEGKKDPDVIEKGLAVIEKQGQRCMGILRNLLEFSRRKPSRMKSVNVNQVIEEALAIMAYHIEPGKTKIEVIKRYDPNLSQVKADPDQLQQVFLNLCINARDAMSSGGTLTIVTKNAEKEVIIEFIDTGCGIPEDKLGLIFKPLYTTKEEGKGTGLGLSVSKEIIERHNGRIDVKSEVGKGTTFTVRLLSGI